MKVCYKCKIPKESFDFYKDNSRVDSLSAQCKQCTKDYQQDPKQKIQRLNYLQKPEVKARNKIKKGTLSEIKLKEKERGIKMHGINMEIYNKILLQQGNACAICKKVPVPDSLGRIFHIDHNHECCPSSKSCGKCIRGLLCHKCNSGIGFLNDSIENLKSAIIYLRKSGNVL